MQYYEVLYMPTETDETQKVREKIIAKDEEHLKKLVNYRAGAVVIEEVEEIGTDREEKCWTTADGLEVPYSELTEEHLKNIIEDGYRNSELEAEANIRLMDYPDRAVDELSVKELFQWKEALSSCAIEGNEAAEWVLEAWDEDHEIFLFRLNQFLEIQNETN